MMMYIRLQPWTFLGWVILALAEYLTILQHTRHKEYIYIDVSCSHSLYTMLFCLLQSLRMFRRKSKTPRVDLADFMKHLADQYSCESPYELGIRIQSLGLPISVRFSVVVAIYFGSVHLFQKRLIRCWGFSLQSIENAFFNNSLKLWNCETALKFPSFPSIQRPTLECLKCWRLLGHYTILNRLYYLHYFLMLCS